MSLNSTLPSLCNQVILRIFSRDAISIQSDLHSLMVSCRTFSNTHYSLIHIKCFILCLVPSDQLDVEIVQFWCLLRSFLFWSVFQLPVIADNPVDLFSVGRVGQVWHPIYAGSLCTVLVKMWDVLVTLVAFFPLWFVQSCKSIVLDVDNSIDFQNLDASFGDRFVPFY